MKKTSAFSLSPCALLYVRRLYARIAVYKAGRVAVLQSFVHFLRCAYGTMPAARAAEGHEQPALALLYKLEQYTVELVKTNQQIIALTKQFEASYKEEGIISAEK